MSNPYSAVTVAAAYPTFLRDGAGKCKTHPTPDDFTEDGQRKGQRAARERARRTCWGCPFLKPCHAWAVDTMQEGVYGGTTTEERRNKR